jgi:hypothetical protein
VVVFVFDLAYPADAARNLEEAKSTAWRSFSIMLVHWLKCAAPSSRFAGKAVLAGHRRAYWVWMV